MKKISLALSALVVSAAAFAQGGSDPLAYGVLLGGTNHGTTAAMQFWFAENGKTPLLGSYEYADVNSNNVASIFVATRLRSFSCSKRPFVGKVGDAWLEGYGATVPGLSVVPRVLHLVFTDSESNFLVLTPFTYAQVDIYKPNDLTKSLHSRFIVCLNATMRILGNCPPMVTSDGAPANSGAALTGPRGAGGMNDEGGKTVTSFWVSKDSNGNLTLHRFVYGASSPKVTVAFIGDRIWSFECTDHGFFGKQSEFWLEGREVINDKIVGTPRLMRVIVTDTENPNGVNFMYVAIYRTQNLTEPIYQQVSYIGNRGDPVHILCSD